MANIVQISDFTGEFQIQQDPYTEDKFDPIRNEWELNAIYELLGAELGALFVSDLDPNGVPSTTRFVNIYNAFAEDYSNCVIQSKGLKFYIKALVWFYFARQNPMRVTISGNKNTKGENSLPSVDQFYLIRIYNEGIQTGKNIQWYIEQNSSDYPEFNGQYLDYLNGV